MDSIIVITSQLSKSHNPTNISAADRAASLNKMRFSLSRQTHHIIFITFTSSSSTVDQTRIFMKCSIPSPFKKRVKIPHIFLIWAAYFSK